MGNFPKISLCLIVKDEESSIARCLDSARGIAEEIIVTDTGSGDATKQICGSLGADVYDFEWRDDFSAARNAGLERASGDWVMWLDADEELLIPDEKSFLETVGRAEEDLLALDMIHFYGEDPPEAARSYHSAAHRLFRNHRGIVFENPIHERMKLDGLALNISIEAMPNALIRHWGYMDSIVAKKEKANRNLSLLQREKAVTSDPWISYHIAGEYYRKHDDQKAYEEVNSSIRAFLGKGLLPPALAYKLKYELLLNAGLGCEAIDGLEKALLLYPDYVDLHYYHALMRMVQGNYAEAEKCFIDCLQLGERNAAYLTLTGAGSFFAYFYLGSCYEAQGKMKQAKDAYQRTLALCPNFPEAAKRLAAVLSLSRE